MQSKEIISKALTQKVSTILFLVFTLIVASLLRIFSTLVIRHVVDNVLTKSVDEDPNLAFWVGSFVIAGALWFFTEIFNKTQAISIGTHVTTSLSKSVYSAGMRADINEIGKLEKEEIAKKINKDCSKIGNEFIGKNWVDFWKEIIVLVAIFITMMVINPVLGLITFAGLPVYYMSIVSIEKYVKKMEVKAEKDMTDREKTISENFAKIKSIKLKNGILHEEEDFQKKNEQYINAHKTMGNLKDISNRHFIDLFVVVVLAVVLGIGGVMEITNQPKSSIGTLVSFIIFTPIVYSSLKKVMNIRISPSIIKDEFESLNKILTIRSEIRSEPINTLDDIHILKFEDVTYISHEDRSIESLSFDLKRGEKLGIISYEGNSKVSIFELLTKLVRPKDGMITINNCDINKINTFYLRDIITAVPQERCLFNDTIANNITYPLEFDEYNYNDALNKSGLKDILLTLEDKDQTIIDEENMLPQDVMERITLANAFYKDSKIFVLNEATSSLDIRSEEAIMSEIYKLKNKMIIIMTNKIYNIINCDKVLILENDQVLEYGKVADLIQDRNSVLSKMTKKVKVQKNSKVS